MAAVRVIVSGRVQGVWFRGWTCERARALGLSGWVRNRSDGTVEAVFSGTPEALETIIAECSVGPPMARVTQVQHEPCADPELNDFTARPTV